MPENEANAGPGGAPGRALVVGEALVDVVRGPSRGPSMHPGGSPMNVAVGLARLGVPTVLATAIGDDDAGRRIAAHLERAGVGLAPGSVGPGATSTAVATLDETGAARYEFDLRLGIPAPDTDGAALVHAGSIGALVEPGASAVAAAFARAAPGTLVSFDPNVRPEVMGGRPEVVSAVEALAGRAHVVKMSDEDAAWLYPGLAPEAVAARFLGLGAAVVAVTRGARGCLLATPRHRVRLPSPRVAVADTIGAGDAFMSGMLSAVLSAGMAPDGLAAAGAGALEGIARTALASAAVTVARPGADPPSRAELEAALLS